MTSHLRGEASESSRVFRLLGGNKTLGTRPLTEKDYIRIVREGLPYPALRSATKALELPVKTLAENLHLNTRTMLRRKHGRLSPVESERIMRLVRVAARAEIVLGDRQAALDWLASPNRALEGQAPLALLDTDLGAEEILQVLGRLREGVYT